MDTSQNLDSADPGNLDFAVVLLARDAIGEGLCSYDRHTQNHRFTQGTFKRQVVLVSNCVDDEAELSKQPRWPENYQNPRTRRPTWV